MIMPSIESFGMSTKTSSKARALTKLSKWEKNEQNVYIGLNIRRKVVDGKTVTSMSVDRSGPCGPNDKRPLPMEFTDREAFKSHLDTIIDGIEKQL